jgi:two-component system, chemotaxis family, sensor kinase CheA
MPGPPPEHQAGRNDPRNEDFFVESVEILTSLGAALLRIEAAIQGSQRIDIDDINEVFRRLHTLKSVAPLLGLPGMAGLAHELESHLDAVRLGRAELTLALLDLLFDAVAVFDEMLAQAKRGEPESTGAASVVTASLAKLSEPLAERSVAPQHYDLGPEILGVLTEFEEHRLRTAIEAGLLLYRVAADIPLANIETVLEQLRAKVKPIGELITYLPVGEGSAPDAMAVEAWVATKASLSELQAVIAQHGTVFEVPKVQASHAEPNTDPLGSKTLARMAPAFPAPFQAPETSELRRAPDDGQAGIYSVRVDIRKLEELLSSVGELLLIKHAFALQASKLAERDRRAAATLREVNRAFERELRRLQNSVLEVRLVSLSLVLDSLARSVRQISRDLGKPTQFIVTGAETEVDKLIVDQIAEPLLHLFRNALDHGLEAAEVRAALGKPPEGTLAVNAYQAGGRVIIEVEDDGAGIQPKLVRARALEAGLITEDEAQDFAQEDWYALLFEPGFSTRKASSDLSGRGVGLDVVKTKIARLGGSIEIRSVERTGTTIILSLPVTLAIARVLVIEVLGQAYCVPLSAIDEVAAVDMALLRYVDARLTLVHRGQVLQAVDLRQLFADTEGPHAPQGSGNVPIVIARHGQRRVAILADRLVAQDEVVVKPLGGSVRSVPYFSGAADLGKAQLALIIDPSALIDAGLSANAPGPHAQGSMAVASLRDPRGTS